MPTSSAIFNSALANLSTSLVKQPSFTPESCMQLSKTTMHGKSCRHTFRRRSNFNFRPPKIEILLWIGAQGISASLVIQSLIILSVAYNMSTHFLSTSVKFRLKITPQLEILYQCYSRQRLFFWPIRIQGKLKILIKNNIFLKKMSRNFQLKIWKLVF